MSGKRSKQIRSFVAANDPPERVNKEARRLRKFYSISPEDVRKRMRDNMEESSVGEVCHGFDRQDF